MLFAVLTRPNDSSTLNHIIREARDSNVVTQSWVVANDRRKKKRASMAGSYSEHSYAIIVSFYRVDHTPGSRDPVLHRATNA